MASRYWGINRGQHYTDVTEGSSSPGKAIEIKYDLTTSIPKEELVRLIEEEIMQVILKDQWPPA